MFIPDMCPSVRIACAHTLRYVYVLGVTRAWVFRASDGTGPALEFSGNLGLGTFGLGWAFGLFPKKRTTEQHQHKVSN